ncbi:TetR/AcrR family transcriptional regulator [Pseudokineococcus basanitobsidens]|uniref:TetR/AcrR family transcriptional regulator n=1 Tax=Pseudokineococcus basanitobsidens TaxID=1926649 RepID=A0ABU8RKC3_9ACTN
MTTTTRERLLRAGADLFFTRGITATGVDAVVRASGVSKPTLYAHFPSKRDLVAGVLEARWHDRRAELEAWLRSRPAGDGPVALLDWLAGWYAADERRGCAFLNAAAELVAPEDETARAVVRAEKRWVREVATRLAEQAGLADPAVVGSQVALLVDGVAGRVLVEGPGAAVDALEDARAAASLVVAAARVTP